MKLEINENENNNFYDELIFVQSNYKKLLIKKKKNVSRMTIVFLKYILISIVFGILTYIMYNETKDNFYYFALYIYGLLVIFAIVFIFITKRRINDSSNKFEKTKITLNDKDIEYKSLNSIYKIEWNNLAFILFNKYSICFIPKDGKGKIIAISIKYNDKISEYLKKHKKDNLIYEK